MHQGRLLHIYNGTIDCEGLDGPKTNKLIPASTVTITAQIMHIHTKEDGRRLCIYTRRPPIRLVVVWTEVARNMSRKRDSKPP